MLKYKALFVVFWASSFFFLNAAYSEAPEELANLQLKIENLKLSQQKLDQRIRASEAELVNSRKEITRIEGEKLQAEQAVETVKDDLSKSEALLGKITSELAHIQVVRLLRFKSAYMNLGAPLRSSQVLLTDQQDAGKLLFYFHKIRDFESKLILQQQDLTAEKKTAIERANQLLITRQKAQRSVEEKRQEIASKITKQEVTNKALKVDLENRTKLMRDLQSQKLRLESVLTAVTGGSTETAHVQAKESNKASSGASAFEGSGLVAPISSPCDGIERGTFGGKLPFGAGLRKGIEFETSPGASSYAVARGKVIFAGPAPNYGNLVIVDHGQRMYSLYGQLTEASVKVSDLVSPHDRVGGVGGTCYFEVRVGGRPVDPKKYLKR